MNRRIIEKILCGIHARFVESIKDEHTRKLVSKYSIITGGSIVSLLLNERVSDFDYYFTNKETVLAVTNYYVHEFNRLNPKTLIMPQIAEQDDRVRIMIKSAGIAGEGADDNYQYFERLPDKVGENWLDKVMSADEIPAELLNEVGETEEKEKYRPVFLSDNAITLSDKIQLVIRFYGDPEEIHENYDFAHCKNYWTAATGKLTLDPLAIESILTKNMVYQGSLYPVCSVIRMRKFLKAGWHINAGQILKMLFQVSQLDLTNVTVLEDQLTGVDAAYFHQIIDYCKARQEKDPEFKVTMPYLLTIIDRIFG